MTEKIYGVNGLMEWDALIVCGKARLRVRFEGGSSSGFGEAPALYRTTNPAAQHIIETSSYFKEKRIRLLRVIHRPSPVNPKTPTSPDTPAPPAMTLEDKEFNDPQQARRYMHETFGVTLAKMMNSEQIKGSGELYGLNLKWRTT